MANEMRDRLVELIKQAKQKTKNANCDMERNMHFADHFIENDVVPVVRCKDCKHGDFYCNSILCGNAHAPWYNDEFDALMELDDYCSYGERRCSDG